MREKAVKIVSTWQTEGISVDPEYCVAVLSELLVYIDGISKEGRDAVEDVRGQLEVADKQLRATRAFLEEQASEREAEREEWERQRRLQSVSRSQSQVEQARGTEASEGEDAEQEQREKLEQKKERVA